MKKILLTIVIVFSLQGYKSMAQSNPDKVVAELPGYSLKWIEAAEPEFRRRNFDVNNYIVSVVDRHKTVVVTLSLPDRPDTARGSVEKYPGCQVEINKNDLKVLHSHYVR